MSAYASTVRPGLNGFRPSTIGPSRCFKDCHRRFLFGVPGSLQANSLGRWQHVAGALPLVQLPRAREQGHLSTGRARETSRVHPAIGQTVQVLLKPPATCSLGKVKGGSFNSRCVTRGRRVAENRDRFGGKLLTFGSRGCVNLP